MKSLISSKVLCQPMLLAAMSIVALAWAPQAVAQPSNRPLLASQTGAKPNLMIALDNSGSMAFNYHETYNVTTDFQNAQNRVCPTPFSNANSATLATFNAGIGGQAVITNGPAPDFLNPTYTCYERRRIGGVWQSIARTDVSVPSATPITFFNWSGQRSANVNPLYYDPKVRYLPRVDGSGNVISPRDPRLPDSLPATERDDSYNVVWVSNQNSVNFRYTVFQRGAATETTGDYRVYHSMYADNAAAPPAGSLATRNDQGHVNTLNPAGFTNRYDLPYTLRIPQHIAYTAAPPVNDRSTSFSYATCTNVLTNALGQETGCSAATMVHVLYDSSDTHTIPTPNNRRDCTASGTANVCTNAEEVANILNWYRWYSTRQLATSTAIGLALADTNANGTPNLPAKFDGELRIGYMPINDTTIPNGTLGGNTILSIQNTPGSPASVPTVSRGVRMLERGSAANTQLYAWLYGILSRGGTPLHNAIDQAANYYRMLNGVTENPWRTDPTSDSSPEMNCRRSFNLLFSDGAWTNGFFSSGVWQAVAPTPAGPDFDNTDGPVFSRIRADNSIETYQYRSNGINTPAGRQDYVPFPSSGTGGLADITARYYWHLDMRPGAEPGGLDNNIQTRTGQPTFWQNMTTYTVGYLIKPSGGEAPPAPAPLPAGLTFRQISEYQTQYKLNGPGGSTVFPSLPTVNLIADDNSVTMIQRRIDDFIHAGYTGGARSFSARSADDVKSIFNTILAEILSASGKDAGVSVNTGGGDNSTLAGRLKYTVSYTTLENSGDILARRLAADGRETGETAWSANDEMPAAADRKVFTMHGRNEPEEFDGRYDDLPTDVQAALAAGPNPSRIPSDESFVNYLRGDDTELDSTGQLFRQRKSKIGAMVNPPAVFMGDARDYAYDQDGSGGVDGRGSYVDYTNRKRGYPKSLFVATNAGTMHAFSAEAGTELAAVMPRRSLRRALNFASDPYTFEYVLDGPITENDIFDRTRADGLPVAEEWRAWRHLAVGTGGRGEKVVYAVQSPINPGTNPNRDPEVEDYRWETGPDLIDSADGGDVTTGYMSNAARSGQTEDLADETDAERGRWIVAINNGHYNGEPNGSKAGLVVLDAVTGEVIRTIPLPNNYSAGVGLSGVTLLRSYGTNTRVVAAYAGDANGNLWKFNLSGAPSTWGVEHNAPLFTVPPVTVTNSDGSTRTVPRPIYGHPAWQPHEAGGFIVVFATGIVLEDDHLEDLGQQTIYGIWDRQTLDGTMLNGDPFTQVEESQLEERTVEGASRRTRDDHPFTYFAITGDPIDWETQRGWFIRMNNVNEDDDDLRAGERSIADVQNFGRSVIITSTVLRPPPAGEMCTISDLPPNYIYIVNAQSASPELSRSFDWDGDGRLDAWDSDGNSRVDAGYAVAYAPRGGFTRGISVSRFRARPDGTALPDDPASDVGTATDPQVTESVTDRLEKAAHESAGESSMGANNSAPKCRTMRGIVLGTGEEPLTAGVFCPTTGWSRTQFQLSGPPRN